MTRTPLASLDRLRWRLPRRLVRAEPNRDVGPYGKTAWISYPVVARAGWPSRYVGENLTAGQVDQSGAMASWEASPGHRANLVNRRFTHIGAACAESRNRVYWVQVLAS